MLLIDAPGGSLQAAAAAVKGARGAAVPRVGDGRLVRATLRFARCVPHHPEPCDGMDALVAVPHVDENGATSALEGPMRSTTSAPKDARWYRSSAADRASQKFTAAARSPRA